MNKTILLSTIITFIVIGAFSALSEGSNYSKKLESNSTSELISAPHRKCEALAKFEINQIQYQIDLGFHTIFNWVDLDDKKHRRKELLPSISNCKEMDLGEAKFVTMNPHSGVTIFSGKEKIVTTYQRHFGHFEEARKNHQNSLLDNGIEKIVLKGRELYILPFSETNTANNEPVLIDCDGASNPNASEFDRCAIQYLHIDGNFVGHSFIRNEFSDGQLYKAYSKTLNIYNNFKIIKEK